MKKSILLAGLMALGLSASHTAFAADTGASSQTATGAAVTPSPTSGDLPDDGTAPSNRPNTDYGTLDSGTADTNPGTNQPPTTRNADTTETRLPLKGANSFTQAEATRRLESAGYSQVSGLAKDDQSVWRGTAVKDGQQVAVGLDYRGNITEKTLSSSQQ